ncbi:pyrroloquinoline quinone precursor peptide PqqA [Massilia sp. YIM B02763]|uniref:pyrroloquinoline quinone precursor peptide PqqA n=1 Tax=Massilia sp. YIM B02763 TaxID=3050130 RepID=UPI0025B66233|nr:pyrroloquinoline quinone precursor peptide PqqA [Massilia sp. YIM B02763]MDN4055332.1 pyrroloquinoline quinone precursor peptide PqqA [Massilia sp. YIM B02763]
MFHIVCIARAFPVKLRVDAFFINCLRRTIMSWAKPEFIDLRFGFEITMYILNR